MNLPESERSTWQKFTDEEREALAMHDYVKLFKLGAHHFLTLTLGIALFERDYTEPLEFQRENACSLPPALVAALPSNHHETRARKQVNLYEGRMAKL